MTRWIAPFGLLAELTYRCPLACAYCSNPLNMAAYTDELTTDEWRRVFDRGRATWVCCSATCPAGSRCCAATWSSSCAPRTSSGMYTNLVTSAIGPVPVRGREELREAGLDHVQVSVQADEPAAVRPDRRHPRRSSARSRRAGWSRSWAGR